MGTFLSVATAAMMLSAAMHPRVVVVRPHYHAPTHYVRAQVRQANTPVRQASTSQASQVRQADTCEADCVSQTDTESRVLNNLKSRD
jgi:hypothetical protein